jgi:Flp pilus assembly protein TadD
MVPASRPFPKIALLALVALAAFPLAGCATRGAGGSTVFGMSRPAPGTQADVQAAAEHWRQRFERNPGDEQAAFAFSRALLAQDQRAQAVAVLQRAVVASNGNRFLQGELGKAMAANGQFQEAINVFTQAHSPDRPDWRILSAHGAVLDQVGRPQEAREYYLAALRIAPGEPAILSNLGLSHALAGDLSTAERHLRQAVAHPRAEMRARQNLALVLGLQGRFPEAEEWARRDLPPEQAEANVRMMRSMVAQTNRWNDIRGGGRPAPAAPAASRAPSSPPARAEAPAPASAAQAPMRLGALPGATTR